MNNLKSKEVVSIVVPMYNVESYISECVQSIKEQTYDAIQCIIVDDGSTDNSVKMVNELIKDDERFILITQPNGGPAKARNNGLVNSTGDYVLFVDSDDKLEKNSIELLLENATKNQTGIVLGKTLRFDQRKEWEVTSHVKHKLTTGRIKELVNHPELFYGIGPAAKLFRKDIIEGLFFDETKQFAEDQLFVLSAYLKAKSISTIEDVVYYYRVRENDESLTQKYKKNPVENLKVLLDLMGEARYVIGEESEDILIAYYNRLFEIELRVLFKNILLSKKREQVLFYELFCQFLTSNNKIVTQCNNYYNFIIKEQLQYLFLVKGKAMDSLTQLMKLSIDGLNSYQEETEKVIKAGKINRVFLKLKALTRKVINR